MLRMLMRPEPLTGREREGSHQDGVSPRTALRREHHARGPQAAGP